MNVIADPGSFPNFAAILAEVLSQWPEHEKYLRINVGEREPALLEFSERLSGIILKLAAAQPEGLQGLARDYRYLCQRIVLPEEMHFRRHGRYRLESFAEALRTVYNNKPFMTRYMNGLLLSDVIWINHCRCMMQPCRWSS